MKTLSSPLALLSFALVHLPDTYGLIVREDSGRTSPPVTVAQCVETQGGFSCNAVASQSTWEAVCMSKSRFCSGCTQCVAAGAIACPENWFSFQGHCYQTSMQKLSYYASRNLCQSHGGRLISINSALENAMAQRICHTAADPITYPKDSTRTSCWIGLYEKPGTGTVQTPQNEQIWLWLDGTTVTSNGYTNWAEWPGLGNHDGQGNHYYEPNNQKTIASAGFNVRHAVFNKAEGGFKGFWYDNPSETLVHALCEVDPKVTVAALHAVKPGWETKIPLHA